jgi:hypothetical protein
MGSDGQFDGIVYSRCVLAGMPTDAELDKARAVFDAACQPATFGRLNIALGELALLCKSRPEETEDVAARIAIFAGRLGAYPADVALEAIRRWGNSEKWFPAWAELRARCDMLGSKRMVVRDAVMAARP